MNRNEFIGLLMSGALTAPALLTGCSYHSSEAYKPWDGPSLDLMDEDVRLRILSYAILSPSPHNRQPWWVDLHGEGIKVTIEPHSLFLHTDPNARQIVLAQGIFLEFLCIAATHYGLRPEIQLFPRGVPTFESLTAKPVAQVFLKQEPDIQQDDLFHYIPKRRTNRRIYEGPPLTENEIAALAQSYDNPDCPLRLFTAPDDIRPIAEMMTEAMRIQSYDRPMQEETVAFLRFSDAEIDYDRNGIGLENLGLTGLKLALARIFISRRSAFDESFLERTIEATRSAAFSAQAIGLITSHGTSRLGEIVAGRAFARIHLTATKLGLALHPMSQVMEIESIKRRFLESLGIHDEDPQMLFRIGRADQVPPSPRRYLFDFTEFT